MPRKLKKLATSINRITLDKRVSCWVCSRQISYFKGKIVAGTIPSLDGKHLLTCYISCAERELIERQETFFNSVVRRHPLTKMHRAAEELSKESGEAVIAGGLLYFKEISVAYLLTYQEKQAEEFLTYLENTKSFILLKKEDFQRVTLIMTTKEDFDKWLSEKVNEAIPTPLDPDLTIDQLIDLVYSYLKLQFEERFDAIEITNDGIDSIALVTLE